MKQLDSPQSALRILSSGDPNTLYHDGLSRDILRRVGPPHRLLSSSAKIKKCESVGFLARVLYLTSGVFCPAATKGCRTNCLGHTSGRMAFPTHARARDSRTALFIENRQLFLRRLRAELTLLETDALQYGLTPAVRLNGTSDLPWERIDPELFADFSNIQFFDYTKLYRRVLDFSECTFPTNYHLTFSVDAHTVRQAQDILHRGGTVAAVFWPNLPTNWWGFPVIDGDLHDARFLDPQGVVVGLRAKGLARVDTTGFTIRPCPNCGPAAPQLELQEVIEGSRRITIHRCPSCSHRVAARWARPRPAAACLAA